MNEYDHLQRQWEEMERRNRDKNEKRIAELEAQNTKLEAETAVLRQQLADFRRVVAAIYADREYPQLVSGWCYRVSASKIDALCEMLWEQKQEGE